MVEAKTLNFDGVVCELIKTIVKKQTPLDPKCSSDKIVHINSFISIDHPLPIIENIGKIRLCKMAKTKLSIEQCCLLSCRLTILDSLSRKLQLSLTPIIEEINENDLVYFLSKHNLYILWRELIWDILHNDNPQDDSIFFRFIVTRRKTLLQTTVFDLLQSIFDVFNYGCPEQTKMLRMVPNKVKQFKNILLDKVNSSLEGKRMDMCKFFTDLYLEQTPSEIECNVNSAHTNSNIKLSTNHSFIGDGNISNQFFSETEIGINVLYYTGLEPISKLIGKHGSIELLEYIHSKWQLDDGHFFVAIDHATTNHQCEFVEYCLNNFDQVEVDEEMVIRAAMDGVGTKFAIFEKIINHKKFLDLADSNRFETTLLRYWPQSTLDNPIQCWITTALINYMITNDDKYSSGFLRELLCIIQNRFDIGKWNLVSQMEQFVKRFPLMVRQDFIGEWTLFFSNDK
jgi:hypothetical protein